MDLSKNKKISIGLATVVLIGFLVGFKGLPQHEAENKPEGLTSNEMSIGGRTVSPLFNDDSNEVSLVDEKTLTVTASSTQALQIEDAEGNLVARVDTITNDGKLNIFGYSEFEAIPVDPSSSDTAHSLEQSIQNTANNANQHTSVGIQAAHTDAFDLTKDFAGMAGLVLTANNSGAGTVSSTLGINIGMSNTTGAMTEALGINIFGLKISGTYNKIKGLRFQDPGFNPDNMYAFDFEGNWLKNTNMVSVMNDGAEKYMILSPTSTAFHVNMAGPTSTLIVGEVGQPACWKVRDSDDAGWTYFTFLDGSPSGSTNSCE